MKNKIVCLSVALCTSLLISAQNVVRFVSVSPTSVCNGQNDTAKFVLQASPQIKDSAIFQLDGINQTAYFPKIAYADLAALPTQIVNGTQAHYFLFIMPTFYYNGPVFIQCDGDMLPIDYTTCTTTGIEVYQLSPDDKVTYYDLTGNIIEKRYNELIIVRSKSGSKKIIFQSE